MLGCESDFLCYCFLLRETANDCEHALACNGSTRAVCELVHGCGLLQNDFFVSDFFQAKDSEHALACA